MRKVLLFFFSLFVLIQFNDNIIATTGECNFSVVMEETPKPKMDVFTENDTIECKRNLLHELPDPNRQENLQRMNTDSILESKTKEEHVNDHSGTDNSTELPSEISKQLAETDLIQKEANDSESECGKETLFYHNITIAAELLPPLLQQARNRTFVKMLESDQCSNTHDKIFYRMKNFVFIKHMLTYVDETYEHEPELVLAIFSSTFDDILNREAILDTSLVHQFQDEHTPLDTASSCNSEGTCSANSYNEPPICYCDDLCPVYNDCCLNAGKTFRNSHNVVLHKSVNAFMTCFENDYLSPNDFSGYWVIYKCPDLDPKSLGNLYKGEQYIDIQKRCEFAHDDAYFVPVVSLKTKLHYINAYCALCHNEDSYIFWSQKRAFQFGIFGPLKSSADVISTHPPAGYEARVCFNFSFADCPETLENFQYGRIFSKLCRSHQNPVASSITLDQTNFPNLTKFFSVHKNMYCFTCNTRFIRLHSQQCFRNVSSTFYDWSTYSWIFRADQVLDVPRKSGEKCQPGELWKPVLQKCIQLECPPYKTRYNGRCEDIVTYIEHGTIKLRYYINGNITLNVYKMFIYRCSRHLKSTVQGFQGVSSPPFEEAYVTRSIELHIEVFFQQPFTISQMHVLPVLEQWTFKYSEDMKVDLVFIPIQTEEIYTFKEPTDQYLHFSLECGFVGLNESYFMNESIVCTTNEQPRARNDNRRIETCKASNLVNSLETMDRLYFAKAPVEEIVLTYASMGLSSIALAFTLFRGFRKNKKSLSSIKRILLRCMTVKLLAQITFLIGCGANDFDLMCYVIGVILHYLWLCSFVWSSICAYFFYFVFVLALSGKGNFLLARDSGIFGFTVLGYTSPLLVVSVSVLFDMHVSVDSEKSYGSGICFITGRETLIFGFAFPTGLMTIFSVVCFLCTVLHMNRRDSLNFSWRQIFIRYFPVCARMSVLLSFTWGLGFLASWLSNKAFWLVFIVMDGLQGFLLSVTFIPCKSGKAVVTKNVKYASREGKKGP